jgi:pilus assembly protein CpaE
MNIFDQFVEDNADVDIAIPEPKANGDLRPNPMPMPLAVSLVEPTVDDVTSKVIKQFATSPVMDEAVVIKSADFHAEKAEDPQLDSLPAAFVEKREDKDVEVPAASIPENTDAKCYALMGTSGGTGVTSICIQLAHDIAKRTQKKVSLSTQADPKVCLIDLDFETGSCAAYLDVPPSLEISDICGPANRIDTSIVQALMSHHESGIAVLATPNALGANSLANPETVLALLDAASKIYDHIILDLPRVWQSWVGAAVAGADHFAMVGELTIPSLHTTRARIANIETVLNQDLHCEVVLNKVERRSFRNSIRLADAEKALQRSVSATICVDYDTTREAINCGEAVEVIRPEARFVKDVHELSLKWLPKEEKSRGIFKDRRRKRAAA